MMYEIDFGGKAMNITEFARLAGVSKASVSRYFNGGYLSNEKREQIEAAIARTGYQPSAQAQMLRTRRTRQVALVLPRLTSERCAAMAQGVTEALAGGDYQLQLLPTEGDARRELAALELLAQGRVDGLIWVASVITREHKAMLDGLKRPLVLLGQQHPGCSSVCWDDLGAAKAVTAAMVAGGRTTPALLGGTLQDRAAGAARRRGFEEAVREAGLAVPQSRMLFAQFTMDSGFQQARRLFTGVGPAPDCILCATDAIALGALEYCRSAGLRVPEDVMLAALGDSRPGRLAGLTSARLDFRLGGSRAAARLLELLEDQDSPPRSETLGFELRERASTGTETPLDAADYWSD